MTALGLTLAALPFAFALYAYVLYPLMLRVAAVRRPRRVPAEPPSWPDITIVIPCYNEERAIADTIDRVLAADYPPERREVLVVSDASTDGTDAIVSSYAARGVRLVRLPQRMGKTAAENEARRLARGEIVVNTDASVRIASDSLKPLVRAFSDPSVGVASGRDVSVGAADAERNEGESGYVDYEMRVRDLETRVGSIIGASGCFFATRRGVDEMEFPHHLSRDFASALIAREHGYMSVSVPEAVCFVPRTAALGREMKRKVRTMARGLATLWYKRHLLDPFRYGSFAFMLISHKLCRWLVYLTIPLAGVGLVLVSVESVVARLLLALGIAGVAVGALGMWWPGKKRPPSPIALAGYAVASVAAGVLAWASFLRGERSATWSPTQR